jgi:signal transduction histidine kinase
MLAVPSVVFYPSLVEAAGRARRQLVETRYAPEVVNQRRDLQEYVDEALREIDALPGLDDVIEAADPAPTGAPPSDAAFLVWSETLLADLRLTSSVELYDAKGAIVSRFALKLPELTGTMSQETSCSWELFEEVSPFFAEERRLLHAGRRVCRTGADGRPIMMGSIAVHVMLDYSNLSFISAQSPYVAMLRSPEADTVEPTPREYIEFVVYGWSRAPLYMSGRDAWPLTEPIFRRAYASREPFWGDVTRANAAYEVYFLNDRGGIYALGYPRVSSFGHLVTAAELITLAGATFVIFLIGGLAYGRVTARTPTSGRGLLREVRASFYRKLFLAFVLAAVLPVLLLAFVTRAYIEALMRADFEMEAIRTAGSASRVVEDFGSPQLSGPSGPVVDDSLVVWLSRVVAQDVNIFDGPDLLASSERNLFASGLLPTRTASDVYRAIMLDARPSYVSQESVGGYEYLVAAAPVRVQDREAILTVPFTLRQREIEAQIDELDRRVLLAALVFILVGAGIGYSMAERIADPVNRLMRATQRIARGDLDARIVATSSDELRRLVEAFNRMAEDLQRQRAELERTNRLAAWADMARQVAHDIKNPLTPIQLNAEHLRRVHADRGKPLGPVLEECISNILTQVRLLRQIAGEFSSFASSPTPRPSPTPLGALVDEVVDPYRAGLAGHVTVDVRIPADLPDVVVDRTLLGRALTNVIENALHAMPAGGSLTIGAALESPSTVRLSIADSGVGMTPDSLERIFEPYFSTKTSGTGLGLTIAKRNVEVTGGTIAVESVPGAGTTVTMRLPPAMGTKEG